MVKLGAGVTRVVVHVYRGMWASAVMASKLGEQALSMLLIRFDGELGALWTPCGGTAALFVAVGDAHVQNFCSHVDMAYCVDLAGHFPRLMPRCPR